MNNSSIFNFFKAMPNFVIVQKIFFAYIVISIPVTVSSIGSMRAWWVNSLGESEFDGLDGWARWVNSILSSMSKLVNELDLWARWGRWKLDGVSSMSELNGSSMRVSSMVAWWVIWNVHVRKVFWEIRKNLALFWKK